MQILKYFVQESNWTKHADLFLANCYLLKTAKYTEKNKNVQKRMVSNRNKLLTKGKCNVIGKPFMYTNH